MSKTSLFPGGVLQLLDVLNNGYWRARSQAFLGQPLQKIQEWTHMGPAPVFWLVCVLPIAIALLVNY